MTRPVICLAVALALAVSGCSGGNGSGEDGGPTTELLDRLPADAQVVASVDLAKAREALGEPEGADPLEGSPKNKLRLLFVAGFGLPHLESPTPDPAREALDHGQIDAAATGGDRFLSQVTVVRTRQPVDEALDALVEQGYRREGDVVVSAKPAGRVNGIAYGAAGETDGLLVLASDRELLDAAIEGGGGGAPWRDLLDAVEGPLRLTVSSSRGGCLKGLAAADSLQPAEGEILVAPSDAPDPDRIRFLDDGDDPEENTFRKPFGRADFGEVKTDGDYLRAPYSYDGQTPGPSPVGGLLSDVPTGALYDCD